MYESSPVFRRQLFVGLGLCGLAMILTAGPTLADFQWVPPRMAAPSSARPSPVVPTSPVSVTESVPSKSTLAFRSEPLPVGDTAQEPIMTIQPTRPTVRPSETNSEPALQGFANRVPLAVALRQVLPAEYAFSVDPAVNLETLVSWKGGKTWRSTLQTLLSGADLTFHEDGKIVVIERGVSSARASSTESQAPQVLALPSSVGGSPSIETWPLPLDSARRGGKTVAEFPRQRQGGSLADNPSPLPGADSWTATRGDTLRQVVGEWAARAGVEVSWQSEYDYPLHASIAVMGTFEDAVRTILSGFEGAHPQPIATLHAREGQSGQSVLVVSTRGNDYGS